MEQHNSSQPSGGRQETGHQLFAWLRSTGVHRPDGGWIGGVFGGVSARTGWDVNLLRGLGVVALILFPSPTAMLYGLAWLLVPDRHGEIHAQAAIRGQINGAVLAGGFLAVVGAANVFTPINIAGPFAILVNLVIIAAAGWGAYVLVKNYRKSAHGKKDDGGTPGTGAAPGGETPGEEAWGKETRGKDGRPPSSPAQGTASEAAAAGRTPSGSPQREDGKPAWYPKQTEPQPPTAPAGSLSTSRASSYADYEAPDAEPEDPREREERRRRRMVTWGLLLLIVPATVGLALFSGWLGLSTMTVLSLGTAALVILLAARHMVSAARGRKGNGFLLACATTAMVLLTLSASGAGQGIGSSANYVFGDYNTSENSMNTAFSNTTMDLRHLTEGPEDGVSTHHAEVNMAFANTTVVVPDETRVLISNGHAMGSLNVHTQERQFSESGISGGDAEIGPDDAENEIMLDLNSAFGNIDIYDATTYEEEVEQQ